MVTASWLEIETLTTDTEQSESDLDNPQDWSFITKLPSLNKTFRGATLDQEELEDCRKLDSRDASVLLVGTRAGSLYVLMNGYLQYLLSVTYHMLLDGMGAQCDASQ